MNATTAWRYRDLTGGSQGTPAPLPSQPRGSDAARPASCRPGPRADILGLRHAPPLVPALTCGCGRRGSAAWGGRCLRCWQAEGGR